MNTPFALIILDGWGMREDNLHNAIAQAKTPYFDYLWANCPHSLLDASGGSVGLPEGQIGNSEVGHMNIGAGKVIDTDLVRISKSFLDKSFNDISAIQKLFDHVKKNNSTLHIQGLVSPGGVHSHSQHLYEFLKLCKENNVFKVAIHAFTDGRDTPPQSGADYLKELEDIIADLGIGRIATASGRYYAMDRDKNWDRLLKVEELMFENNGEKYTTQTPSEILRELYKKDGLDELLEPMVFLDENGKGFSVQENDAIFFFNFRSDRARYLSQKIMERIKGKNIYFVTMTEYDKTLGAAIAFPSLEIKTSLANEVSKAGLTQVHISETEKFAHVTYFLNCGEEQTHAGEEFVLIESRKDVKTHDEAPEMRAKEIADKTIEYIDKGVNFFCINIANADMVGHTANYEAIITAIETVDRELKRIVEKLKEKGGVAFITADHGNAETNVDSDTGEKHTAHTMNLVPAIITSNEKFTMHNGVLSDIAPTILNLIGLPIPEEMTGNKLID